MSQAIYIFCDLKLNKMLSCCEDIIMKKTVNLLFESH
jgi:hypothetical protein